MPRDETPVPDLIEWLGGVDISLIDQILKGQFKQRSHILEAGCGDGRNLLWFLRSSFEVHAVDSSPIAVAQVQAMAARLAPALNRDNFRVERVEQLSFAPESFDAVLSIAVLHFARDEKDFLAMVQQMWRVLRPGGLLFVRVGSTIGIEGLLTPLSEPRRYAVPDGSIRFLVDLDLLLKLTSELRAQLLEPIKTVNVQNLRCMTTWVLQKPH